MFLKGRKRKQILNFGKNVLVMLMCFSLTFTAFTPALMADEVQSNTNMRHSPPDFFIPEHRIQMDARVTDPSGVELVRCYFKAQGEADFVFVPMTNTGRNNYSGVLPAPSRSTQQIEYLFLAVNADNQVVKSQTFTIEQKDEDEAPAWQDISTEGDIQVSMEMDQVPADVPGFTDNIAMNAVESGARFGVVAGGLYQLTSSTSGSAAAATTAGTVSAGAAGIGTAGAVALGVGAAAAVGGAAAAGGGSSGGGTSNGPPNGPNGPRCDEQQVAGGPTADTRSIFMGTNSGVFNFSYQAYGIPDQFIVRYAGNILHNTGCVGSSNYPNVTGPGSGSVDLTYNYNGQDTSITVEVVPNCHGTYDPGTAWNYTVTCPQ